MVETAAHLCDHVFPRLPVRQWVLSVPKRLRYFMQRDGAVLNMVLRIFLRVIAQTLQTHRPGAAHVDRAALRKEGAALVCRCAKQHSEPGSDKRGAKVDELHLTPLDLIDRIAAPVPAQQATVQPAQTDTGVGVTGVAPVGNAAPARARARATQALTGAVPVGSADRQIPESLRDRPQLRAANQLCPQLIEIPAGVSDVRWADASDRVHYRGRADQTDPGPHRGRLGAPAHMAGTRAAVVGRQ